MMYVCLTMKVYVKQVCLNELEGNC